MKLRAGIYQKTIFIGTRHRRLGIAVVVIVTAAAAVAVEREEEETCSIAASVSPWVKPDAARNFTSESSTRTMVPEISYPSASSVKSKR